MRRSQITRLERLEAQCPERSWMYSEGLTALLWHAHQYPPEPCAMAALWHDARELTGLAKLLREAWEWRA